MTVDAQDFQAARKRLRELGLDSQDPTRSLVDAAKYSKVETLGDGRRITIRSLRHADRDEFTAAAKRTSSESIYRRFFASRRDFSETEVSFFVDVKHAAFDRSR